MCRSLVIATFEADVIEGGVVLALNIRLNEGLNTADAQWTAKNVTNEKQCQHLNKKQYLRRSMHHLPAVGILSPVTCRVTSTSQLVQVVTNKLNTASVHKNIITQLLIVS